MSSDQKTPASARRCATEAMVVFASSSFWSLLTTCSTAALAFWLAADIGSAGDGIIATHDGHELKKIGVGDARFEDHVVNGFVPSTVLIPVASLLDLFDLARFHELGKRDSGWNPIKILRPAREMSCPHLSPPMKCQWSIIH